MNFQSVAVVRGIHGSPSSLFMVANALVMIGSWAIKEDIFFARASSMAQMWKYWSFLLSRVISQLSLLVSISSF